MPFSALHRTCSGGASCSEPSPTPQHRRCRLDSRAASFRLSSVDSTALAPAATASTAPRKPRHCRDTVTAAFPPSNDAVPKRYPSDPDEDGYSAFAEPPSRFELLPKEPRPTVRVRLSVHYRVHSRQMLCIGGSQIPFGWAFLSIAKVPMTWNTGDIWTVEVHLPAGQRVEYKYVILEEQDWTKQENEDSEGLVEINYRSGADSGRPPDFQVIQKQMAIVAWQPGPNRVLLVPDEARAKGDPGLQGGPRGLAGVVPGSATQSKQREGLRQYARAAKQAGAAGRPAGGRRD